jgi:trans-aconitate 2-methyltransferase
MATTSWDPGQYERFKAERAQPFWDLAALLRPVPAPRVVDLGCGTAELTAALLERLGAVEGLGIDNDAAMLAEARSRAVGPLRVEAGNLATFEQPGAWDVVLANASLQWVPDHPTVLARWVASLRPGGQLAVQVPANSDHPSHVVAAEVAATEPFRSAFPGGAPPPDTVARNVLAPERYAELLHGLGLEQVHVRLQVYLHELGSTADVVEWVKGTTLTRFKRALPPDTYEAYVDRYRAELVARMGDRRPYLYPFRRILMLGTAPGA